MPLLPLLLVVAGLGSPASAQDSPVAECDNAGLSAAGEQAALAHAAECDRPVEVKSARTPTQRQLAQPDGSITLESYLRPQWAPDGAGGWIDADPTLVADPTGRISAAAALVEVTISPGGAAPLVTAVGGSGGSITLTWPEELPEPVLEGATATYAEVFEGVDLRVTADVDGFSYALVVRSAEAADNPALKSIDVGIDGDGLELAQTPDGTVVATDPAGGTVFSASRVYMWDSAAPPQPSGARATAVHGHPDLGRMVEMGMELAGGHLRVLPDQDMLTDPETVFPVTIDPAFTSSQRAWTVVADGPYADTTWWDNGAWPRSDGLRIGFQGITEPYATWRSLVSLDTVALRGSTVNSVSVQLTVYETASCADVPLELWHVLMISQDEVPTSWNSVSSSWSPDGPLETRTVGGTGGPCGSPSTQVTFESDTLRQEMQERASVPYAQMTFGLRAGDESDPQQWTRAYAESMVLTANYTPVMSVPSGLTTDGVGCLAPTGSRATGTAPVLSGEPRIDDSTLDVRVEVRAADLAENLRSWLGEGVPAGEPVEWQVDPPLPDGEYRWRMRSEWPAEGTATNWSGWCGFTVDSALDTEPGPEADAVLECPVAAGEPLEAADESTALLLAEACDAPAEVTSLRDFDARVMAQPEGTLVAEQFTLPQWALDDGGGWTDVDPSFEVAGDGTITTAAAVSEVEVSGGGAGPLVTATAPEGGSVSLTWPDPLPEPVVDGETVTYPEVLVGVDLRVTAGLDGFSYALVVKDAEAAASPELASVSVAIDAGGGLELIQDAEGTVLAQEPSGEVAFSAPAAFMWDSSQPEDGGSGTAAIAAEDDGSGDPEDVGPARFSEMPLELAGATLTVEPDQALLSDPDVEFPVLIDPPFSGKRMHWASVHQEQPERGWTDDSSWPRKGGMRIGNLQYWPGYPCGDACGLWRSAIRFDIRKLSGRQIISASVKATQTHTSGCGSYGLELWYVTAFKSGTSWNGLADNWQNQLQSKSVASSNRTGGCSGSTPAQGVTFDGSAVRNRVQAHADAGHNSLSFGFRSSNESSKYPYRRIAVKSVHLEVRYNRAAQMPTSLSTDGRGCDTSSPGPWLTTQRPTLSGKPRDPDGKVGAHVQIRRIGSASTYRSWRSSIRTHNTVANYWIPRADKLPSGSYRWRMRSLDSYEYGTDSDWRQWCYFRIDVASPTTPTVELVGDPPTAGEEVTLRLRSSDKHSGMDRFWYGINEEVKRKSRSSSGTTTITFTAPSDGGRNWIYVWSRDKAGNYSNRAVFDFFAARLVEATPTAAWRLDGDGLDDSGQGHELMLGGGVAWEDSGGPAADRSLAFDGTGCVGTQAPVVRTDAEYTVAAWVRLDDADEGQQVVGTVGENVAGFYLRYQASSGTWRFSMSDRDARDVATWTALRSAEPAVVGAWTHLVLLVDPAARHVQLYVNGALSAERDIPFASWNADGPMYLGCAANLGGDTWYSFEGAMQHVGVWQGLLTPEQIRDAYTGELPAGLTGDWQLHSEGTDASAYARDVAVPATAGWVDDQFGRQRSAMRLDGTGWAESAEMVVSTDQSFSVAAWARLDDKDAYRTVLAQRGNERSALYINYNSSRDRWQFGMPSEDSNPPTSWHYARSTEAPEVGVWYHLTGVYDHAASQVRLYVDGELNEVADAPSQPWRVAGTLLIGSAGDNANLQWSQMVGTISDVKTWRGALTDEQVAEAYGGNPAVQALSQWDLNGNGADLVGEHALTMAGTEGVAYEWVEDRSCRPFRALGLRVSGEGYASTDGPVVVTDGSFTVTAWVKLDSTTGNGQTVLAQRGTDQAAFKLQATGAEGWRFAMPWPDAGNADWAEAQTTDGLAQAGVWTHLAGVFDIGRGEVRLYVDGQLAATGVAPESPWSASGPLYIGAAGSEGGAVTEPVHGSIDAVTAWSSTLDPDRISDLARSSGLGGPCP